MQNARWAQVLMRLLVVPVATVSWSAATRADDRVDGARHTAARSPARDLPRLFFITPGTRIDAEPPPGWTDLVLKSVPKLASGEIDTVPETGRTTATLFRTVILADIRRASSAPDSFVLRRVGIGLSVLQDGHDVVINSGSAEALGVSLSTIPKIVLERTEHELADGRLVARTPTFALYRAPVELNVEGQHRKVLLNYAFLVDPATGSLTTAVWWVDAETQARQPAKQMVLLRPALTFESELDVSANRILGSLPLSWSFALRKLPPGQAVGIPPALGRWTARDPESHEDAQSFEDALRHALDAAK